MFENIIIGIAIILLIWACIFSYRLDNGTPKNGNKEEEPKK